MKIERAYNNRTTGQKGAPLGDGAGCVRILMMPEGIIAVGLTGGDSTGIAAAAGGVDGTAPMVLTRQRQCHPGPAGFGWRGIGAPAPEQNASFAIPRLQQNFRERLILKRFGCGGRRTGAANGFKTLTGMMLSERETRRLAAAGASPLPLSVTAE